MIDAKQALAQRNPTRRTLCEVLREIYEIAGVAGMPDIMGRCEEAIIMAKKMDGKLKEYKQQWDAGMWEKTNDPKKPD